MVDSTSFEGITAETGIIPAKESKIGTGSDDSGVVVLLMEIFTLYACLETLSQVQMEQKNL